jgi:hypothetical protein
MGSVDEFVDHVQRQFRTLDGLYERANDEAWTYPDQRVKGAWQWMAHVLETVEFYLGDKNEGFCWGHRFGLDWENDRASPVPSKEDVRAYQDDVERMARHLLAGLTDEDLLRPETIHPWTGKTLQGKLLYLIRHTQQHIGDLNRVLRLNGCEALEWH